MQCNFGPEAAGGHQQFWGHKRGGEAHGFRFKSVSFFAAVPYSPR
jgi:hypothetical protein